MAADRKSEGASKIVGENQDWASKRVRALIDSMNDMVFTTDADGRFTGVYGQAFDEAGLEVEDFLGRTPMEVNRPESRHLHEKAIRALKAGESVRYEWPQGNTIYQTAATPEFDEAGRVVGIVAVRSDVTKLRQQERELEYRHRALFEGSESVMLLIDADTAEIVDANPAALEYYGYRHDEITRLKITDINTLDREQVRDEMRLAASQERRFFEFRHRLSDGTVRDVHVYSGPIDLMGRKLLYSAIYDVTEQKRSEATLKLQSAAIEAAANGVVITDAQGVIVFANEAAVRMTGYSREELIGINPRILKSGQQTDAYYQDFWQTISAGRVWRGDIVNRRKDGSLYTEEMTVAPVTGSRGEITHYVAIKQDVTRERELVDELERSEAWWRAVLENGMDLVGVDGADGTFRYLSPSVRRILGYEPEELIGTVGFDLVHPEDAERIRRSFTEKTTHTHENQPVTMRFRHKDGSWRVMEAVSKNALDDPNVRGMIVNARDVTERVEADQQRRLLESVVVNTRDAVVIANTDLEPDGPRIMYANPAFFAMTGYPPEDVLGRSPQFLYGPKTDREELCRIRTALKAHESVRAELINYAQDGREYLVELEIAPVHDEDGELTHFISVQRDITERREAERRMVRFQEFRNRLMTLADEALESSLTAAFFDKVLEYAVDVVTGADAGSLLVRNTDGNFQYVAVNGFDSRLLEHSLSAQDAFLDAERRQPTIRFGYDSETPTISRETLEVLTGEGVRSGDIRSSMNVPVWIEGELRAVFNLDSFRSEDAFTEDDLEMASMFGRQIGTILHRLDLEAILIEQANTDPLTGLPNRRKGEELLASLIEGTQSGEAAGGLCLLDVDNFKVINDAHGHAFGDQLLREISTRIARATSSFGTLSRWTGDEFLVMCPNAGSRETVKERAEEILNIFTETIRIGHTFVRVNVSMGVVCIPSEAHTLDEAIQNAHIALHEAKRTGKNSFVLYEPSLREAVTRRAHLEEALRSAVANDQIHLHFQPRIDLRNDRVTSVEVLARWTDATLGAISPAEFIPLAEETDLIHDLGARVLDRACRQAKAWLDAGEPRVVAVNLSLAQIQRRDLVDDIEAVLSEHRLHPRWLELEVTESAAMVDVDHTIGVLQDLHSLGVSISIDDFGTAYSSLAHLKLLPVDALKIDRSFVMGITGDPSESPVEASIIQAVIALGKSMNLKIIAEGVETVAQKNFLKMLGCDEAQGYFFGKPVPADRL